MLYGTRASSNVLFPRSSVKSEQNSTEDLLQTQETTMSTEPNEENGDFSFFDRLVIRVDNPVKSYFDVFVLMLVGYSCITSMYNSAFSAPTS